MYPGRSNAGGISTVLDNVRSTGVVRRVCYNMRHERHEDGEGGGGTRRVGVRGMDGGGAGECGAGVQPAHGAFGVWD